MKRLLALMALLLMQACKPVKKYDLAVINASVFNTRKGIVIAHQSILVNADTIADVIDSSIPVEAGRTIDADGKLVTPGMIDAHIHPTRDNFKGLMALVKKVYDSGIKIRIGTDVPNGGKAVEQVLLAQYGFTTPAIIQMATINGAAALGMASKYGAIEQGKRPTW